MGEQGLTDYNSALWIKDKPRRDARRARNRAQQTVQVKPAFVSVYERLRGQPWGFVVYRLAGYDRPGAWTEFRKRWQDIMDQRMDLESDEPGVAEARTHFTFQWVEQANLAGASMQEVAEAYAQLRDVPSGLSHSVCLVVTEEAMDSVLNATLPLPTRAIPGQPAPYGRPDAPFAVALEKNYSRIEHGNEGEDSEVNEDEADFSGQFKVPLEVIVSSLFPMLDTGRGAALLAGYLQEGELWWPDLPRRRRAQ